MRLFSVHLQVWSAAADGEAQFVREGFCWPAFFFPTLWALSNRLWVLAAALLTAQLALALLIAFLVADPVAPIVLIASLRLLIGLSASDWRRWFLTRVGLIETAIVAAPDRVAAERRFFAGHHAGPARP
ncbi:MAG: DUF2628 domain-containing protein [Alphaproteobacteria bacterium]